MFKQGWHFCRGIVERFFQEGCPIQAAGLSYVTLLSLVPLMAVSLAVLSAFPTFRGLGNQLQQMILSNFVAASAHMVQHHLQIFMHQTSKLSVMGLLSLLVTAVLMIFSMEQAFNRIWQVKERRNLVQAFLLYWAVLTFTPILLGVGVAMSSYLFSIKVVHGVVAISFFKRFILFIAPYFFTFIAFTLLYIAVPNCKVKLRCALIGALTATVLFELAKYGFTFYIRHFPTYRLIYGALAAIPLFLIWLYVSWLLVLFGAMVSFEVSKFGLEDA